MDYSRTEVAQLSGVGHEAVDIYREWDSTQQMG